MKRSYWLVVMVVITVILGFIRDHIFVGMNAQIKGGSPASESLGAWKWILTGAFSVAYYLITILFIKLLYNYRNYYLLATGVYGFLLLIAGIVGLTGIILFTFQQVYLYIRAILGIVQSPVVTLVLLSAFQVNELLKKGR